MKKTLFGILVAAVAWIALGAVPNGRMNRNVPLTGAPRRVRPVRVKPVETNRIERQFSLETTAVKNDVKTVSGKFHAGMTRKEAEEASLVDSLFSRDFNDIDRNGDGFLSVREICEETKEMIIKQYAAEGAGTIRHGTLEVKGVLAPGGENAVGSLTWEPATTFSDTMRLNVGDRIVCESAFNLVDATIEVLDRENLKNVASWTVVSSAGRRITGRVKGHNLEGTGYTVHTTPGAVEIVKCGENRP